MSQSKEDRRSAVALAYEMGESAPKVVAKGYGDMAERIINLAKDSGVFVHDSPELVSLLMQVDLEQNIPPDLYRAVAELLAFLYFLEHAQTDGALSIDEWRENQSPSEQLSNALKQTQLEQNNKET